MAKGYNEDLSKKKSTAELLEKGFGRKSVFLSAAGVSVEKTNCITFVFAKRHLLAWSDIYSMIILLFEILFLYLQRIDGRIGSGASQKAAYCKVQLLRQSS